MHVKAQGSLPQGTEVQHLPTVETPSESPFWHKGYRQPSMSKAVEVRSEVPECDDCGSKKNLRGMGHDQMGKRYLCLHCIRNNGTEYQGE